MKSKLEMLKEIIRNSIQKLHIRWWKRIERLSDISDEQMRSICALAGIEYKGEKEQDLVDELMQETYQQLDQLKHDLEAKQAATRQQIRDLNDRISALAHSLEIVVRAEEKKLEEEDKAAREERYTAEFRRRMTEQWYEELQQKSKEGWGANDTDIKIGDS